MEELADKPAPHLFLEIVDVLPDSVVHLVGLGDFKPGVSDGAKHRAAGHGRRFNLEPLAIEEAGGRDQAKVIQVGAGDAVGGAGGFTDKA